MLTAAWLADQETRAAYGSATLKYDIAAALVAARTERHLTQAEFADMLGVSYAYVVRLESGNANPSLGRVGALFATLGVQLCISFTPIGTPDRAPSPTWVCYARPVGFGGRQCGHRNPATAQHCGVCGCTRKASKDRQTKKTRNQKDTP